jgi:hypothetical protein
MEVSDDEIFETFLYQTSRGPKNRYYTNKLRPKKNKNIEDLMKPGVPVLVASEAAPAFAHRDDLIGTDDPMSGVLQFGTHADSHPGHLDQAALAAPPAAILDLNLLGSLTGVAPTSEMAARAVQFEEMENDNKCEGMCSL